MHTISPSRTRFLAHSALPWAIGLAASGRCHCRAAAGAQLAENNAMVLVQMLWDRECMQHRQFGVMWGVRPIAAVRPAASANRASCLAIVEPTLLFRVYEHSN